MAQWMVVVPPGQYQAERLYQQDRLELPGGAMAVGDEALLAVGDGAPPVAAGDRAAPGEDGPVIFARVRVVARAGPTAVTEYLARLVDRPPGAATLGCGPAVERAATGPVALPAGEYERLVARLGGGAAAPRAWMVSLDLPIEASSAAEAVRIFWTYVRQLGPAELPAYVWPRGDELAMRPYVLGVEHEMDPEEGD